MNLLEVRTGRDGAIHLAGELDIASRPSFDAAIAEWTVGDGPLTLDLAELTFLDSTGIHGFLKLAGDREIVLRTPQPLVRRVLDIARLDEHPRIRIEE